jgi:hypothetical protein
MKIRRANAKAAYPSKATRPKKKGPLAATPI